MRRNLTVSATSNNPGLIPDPTVTYTSERHSDVDMRGAKRPWDSDDHSDDRVMEHG